jgi:DivIVA domain-containing protein
MAVATTQPEPEPPAFRPSEIAGHRFSVGRKGFNPGEVHAFLQVVAEHLARLEAQIEWQRARTEHMERQSGSAKDAAYSRLSRDFIEVVRAADEASSRVRSEVEAEARKTIAGAHDEADEIVAAAKAEAEGVLAAARSRAERVIAEATAAAAERAAERASLETRIWSRPDPRAPEVDERPEWFVSMPAPAEAWEEPAPSPSPDPDPPAVREQAPADVLDLEGLDVHFEGSLFDLLDEPGEDA